MFRCNQTVGMVMLTFSILASPAIAETLRCQSVNGNLNCAGSNGMSCQSVDGKKVCVSGHGDVVQTFGAHNQPDQSLPDQGGKDQDGLGIDDGDAMPTPHQRIERHDQSGKKMILQRDGSHVHVQTNWISVDRD